MKKFTTRITLRDGNALDYAAVHAGLEEAPGIRIERASFRQHPKSIEIEYNTVGEGSITDLGRRFAAVLRRQSKTSAFYIIKNKTASR